MWQEKVIEIRIFEETLLELHKEGLISGTVHTCVGQELVPISICSCLDNEIDAVFATHRGHGYYISYGGDTKSLFSEMTGREGALCLGRGGSQHLNYKNFFSNGIQGAGAVQAVGFAWGQKLKNNGGITISQLGDGTLGEGSVYVAFNFASLLKVPVLFVVEVNGVAQSTDTTKTIAGSIEERANAFNLGFYRIKDSDPEYLFKKVETIISHVRNGNPHVLIIETQRLLSHSKGDDDRDPDFIQRQFKKDPLNVWMKSNGQLYDKLVNNFKSRYQQEIRDIKSRKIINSIGQSAIPSFEKIINSDEILNINDLGEKRFVEVLNLAYHSMFSTNDKAIMLGEDIDDPYGGAFKVTKGLSEVFGARVYSTPIAENGILGVSIGLAISGFRPIAEIMFADFVTLAADQIINSAAKYYYMFGEKVICPILVRLVSGGGRGYGPTHSQNMEKLFCGIPGLRVVAISEYHNIDNLLRYINESDRAPVILVEDKKMYTRYHKIDLPVFMNFVKVRGTEFNIPPLVFTPKGLPPALTIVCYGQMVEDVQVACKKLFYEDEIFVDIIVITQIWPLNTISISDSIMQTKRLLVIDPNEGSYSFSSAVISNLVNESSNLSFICKSVTSLNFPDSASKHLENKILPSADQIYQMAKEMIIK
jgi:2-oxoisovalerate dehydrogenase E1 component